MLENQKPELIDEENVDEIKEKNTKKGIIIFISIIILIMIVAIIVIAVLSSNGSTNNGGSDCGSGTCPINNDLINFLF